MTFPPRRLPWRVRWFPCRASVLLLRPGTMRTRAPLCTPR
jgi:hypothetical protein